MAFKEYVVSSFDEYIRCITDIGRKRADAELRGDHVPTVLWSRGHRVESWNLRPTLVRDVELSQRTTAGIEDSSGRAVEEELRRQHYIAKNYHFLSKKPESHLGWMEVMQHHGVKTRILDWSESMIHSLIFALECFFNNKEYRTQDRLECSPCVWVFEPIRWNMIVLREIVKNKKLLDSCIQSLPANGETASDIRYRMELLQTDMEDYLVMRSAGHMSRLFNLSSIVGELQRMETEELIWNLLHGEFYYCLFYLLMHVYLRTFPLELKDAMPLSIVESYHCERIRAQKGAFSLFPYYVENKQYKNAKKLKIYLDAMENMDRGNACLYKIRLRAPDRIAYEVMNAGLNVTWLYPEMPVVANAIEQRKIFT